ncbi:MAG: hypothetical protein R3F14_32520 [Polyangiaceae bacterium]
MKDEAKAGSKGEGREKRGRLADLKADVDRAASAGALALEVAGIKTPTRPLGKKRLLVSGALSFFLGPVGWLYAAPLKEAIPVIVVYVGVGWVLNAIPAVPAGVRARDRERGERDRGRALRGGSTRRGSGCRWC